MIGALWIMDRSPPRELISLINSHALLFRVLLLATNLVLLGTYWSRVCKWVDLEALWSFARAGAQKLMHL